MRAIVTVLLHFVPTRIHYKRTADGAERHIEYCCCARGRVKMLWKPIMPCWLWICEAICIGS